MFERLFILNFIPRLCVSAGVVSKYFGNSGLGYNLAFGFNLVISILARLRRRDKLFFQLRDR